MERSIIIKNNKKYIELPFNSIKRFDDELNVKDDGKNIFDADQDRAYINKKAVLKNPVDFGDFSAAVFKSKLKKYTLSNKPILNIGRSDNNDIVLKQTEARVSVTEQSINIYDGFVYVNGVRYGEGAYPARHGDCLYIDDLKIYIGQNKVECDGFNYTSNLLETISNPDIEQDFPQYKRSPRIIKREPQDKIEVKDPAQKPEKKKGAWMAILTPLVMVCVTVALGIFMGRGWMVLMSATMMTASVAFSIVKLVGDRKDTKQKETKRTEDYSEYLLELRKRLNDLFEQQKTSLLYHNPKPKEIESLVLNHSGRIYEHAANDGDFLCLSIGRSVCSSSYTVKHSSDGAAKNDDELLAEMREVVSGFNVLKDMPNVIDLKKSHFAYVGEKQNIHARINSLVANLAVFQSYHDINIVLLTDELSKPKFEWMRWLPHCRLNTINTLTIISSENHRDKVLGNITSQLKERKMKKDELKKETFFLPHYIFIIDNPKLIISHSIMEYLQGFDMDLGFSLVYTTHLKSNVPENVKTILLVESKDRGTMLLKQGQFMQQAVTFETIDDVDFEKISRGLCPIIHNKGVTTQIPDMLTFFDLYNIKKPEQLPIEKLWSNSACNKSLAVPLGARAKNDIVYLNLHEKAHGPHGLVAGTTGSGKSEAIQAFILSLAVNFSPYDVGFLLIDYKGGGMAKLFEKLPHLLGMITNLDGSESMRALASIKSELARRQRVFNQNNVNNINDYTKIFKAGTAKEPLPHLFIISDEFAELKKEQPEFMKELVSTARIGRSLGVHLILATQKPSGVVDDQIWSNSKFKLALKVQNEADSNEILKTPDAARITQSGRAYLQIGNNEIYELFQTAWSGAPYREAETKQDFDERIYLENSSGQGELLNTEFNQAKNESGSLTTQLDVVVERIATVYKNLNVPPVTKPWLPPLSDNIVSPYINANDDVATFAEQDLSVVLGLVDIPENQQQTEFVHDFAKDGNLSLFGASGFGKSVSITNIILGLSTKNSPTLVNCYIMDLGNSSLIQLKGLPHTADYITYDDGEKLKKFIALITTEIALRKRLFAKQNAVSFSMYNQTASEKIPAIIVVIDNYDAVKEMGTETEEFIVKLTRDGIGVGIYTVISASRANALRYAVLNNFKTKIALYSFDQSDITAAVGRSDYALPEIRGRALVKLKGPHILQTYLPAQFNSDIEYAKNIRQIVGEISTKNTAKKATAIPLLPETAYVSDLELSINQKLVAIGLDAESVLTRHYDLNFPIGLIVGTPATGKTNLLKLVIHGLKNSKIFIADSKNLELEEYRTNENVTMLGDVLEFYEKLKATVDERKNLFESSNKTKTPKEFFSALPNAVLIIDDADNFIETVKQQLKEFENVITSLQDVGISIVATTTPNKLRAFDGITKLLKEARFGVILGNPSEQQIFSTTYDRNFKPKLDIGFISKNGTLSKIMLPKI